MTLIVAKFGGASVASPACIIQAAQKVAAEVNAGNQVVVVVSAMGDETNRLLALTTQLSPDPQLREVDVVISAGEQVACGLMAIALKHIGLRAQSCLGWQIPITTTGHFSRARITSVTTQKLESLLSAGIIPVVAGFQGVSADAEVTTFGRGGSDLTAVAIAAALQADYCMLYKDVDGIYSADPHKVDKAQLLSEVSYEEMLELSSSGSKVIQSRAIEAAIAFDVDIHIKPTFSQGQGTRIIKERVIKEQELVTGIVCNQEESKICLTETPVSPSVSARFFEALAEAKIAIDMIIQNGLLEGQGEDDLTFTLAQEDAGRAIQIAQNLKEELGYKQIILSERVAKISLVGVGMRGHASVAHKLFATLAAHGVLVHGVSTSEIKMSVLVSSDYAELAMRSLHTVFGLDKKDINDGSSKATAA
jgi:aspartate kinase